MTRKLIMAKKKESHEKESTIIWETKSKQKEQGKVIHFPTKHESTYDVLEINPPSPVRIHISSSGFGFKQKLQMAA
ncbi:hypothetical protein SAMN05444392_11239 [Seinonella peptonophila]|uniref:Uncharacterized protein n=1 Tax=Seinonella peptonophila TaxID=112248 RepID=A0A1M5A6U9_9BACL|nr:hypothetical protein [Seinonella peptonophila]SHF25766.1 hypothetical protein SAMN05444392_11239 [Seinonella peptonophila]